MWEALNLIPSTDFKKCRVQWFTPVIPATLEGVWKLGGGLMFEAWKKFRRPQS
jgi:hypothetical protein